MKLVKDYFQQDRDPKHNSTLKWLKTKNPKFENCRPV